MFSHNMITIALNHNIKPLHINHRPQRSEDMAAAKRGSGRRLRLLTLSPEQVYHNRQEEDNIAQLLRRITLNYTGPPGTMPTIAGNLTIPKRPDN